MLHFHMLMDSMMLLSFELCLTGYYIVSICMCISKDVQSAKNDPCTRVSWNFPILQPAFTVGFLLRQHFILCY